MKLSQKTLRIIGVGLVLAVLATALILNALRSKNAVEISDDPLSTGITERWGAALPAGFTKLSVEHIEGSGGYIFARLTFETDMTDVLSQWSTCDAEVQAKFDALIDAQLADPATTDVEAGLIAENRPTIGTDWRWFTLVNEDDAGDVILLAYDPANRTMYISEQQNNAA